MKSLLGLTALPSTPPQWGRKNFASQQGVLALGGPYETESIFDAETENGNLGVADTVVQPSAVSVTFPSGGLFVLGAPTDGRQTFTYSEYDWITKNWVTVTGATDGITGTMAINNAAPVEAGVIPDQTWFTNVPITPIIMGDYVTDADDSEETLTYSGVSITGLSFQPETYVDRDVIQYEGTPAPGTAGTGTATITATDPFGEQVVLTGFDYTIGEGVALPQVDEGVTLLDDGVDEINAVVLPIVAIIPQLDAASPGIIIDQDPEGGVYVAPGTEITLYVSGVEAPDVEGLSQAAAVSAIQAAGLTEDVRTAFSGTVPEGDVISQSPAADTVMLPDDFVTITVSDGPESDPTESLAARAERGFLRGLVSLIGGR